MRSSDGEGQSIRSDALYPALSGEWEVPVPRNAKITPVNEGVGGGVGGPPLRDHLWQGPPLPVTLRLIHPPPKVTPGERPPPTPPSSPSTASLSGVARCWHSNAYFSLFSSLFFFDFHRTNFSRSLSAVGSANQVTASARHSPQVSTSGPQTTH